MSETAPHKCPLCGSQAYFGFSDVKCSKPSCRHFDKATLIALLEENDKSRLVPQGDSMFRAMESLEEEVDEDAKTDPQYEPCRNSWIFSDFDDLSSELSELFRPLGIISMSMSSESDILRVRLFNPPTKRTVQYQFTCETLMSYRIDSRRDLIRRTLFDAFPRALLIGWDKEER